MDNDSLPLFGKDRRDCHFQLLRAAYKAEVDLLLPILFFACSDYGIEWIFNIAGSMAPECFRTLVVGREALDEDLDRLVSDLPEYLRKVVRTDECRDKGSCLAVGHFSALSSLVHPFFQETKGSDIVEMYLTPSCARCKSVLAKSIDRRREDVWAKIPSYYGFPAWEVIQLKLEELAESQYEVRRCFTSLMTHLWTLNNFIDADLILALSDLGRKTSSLKCGCTHFSPLILITRNCRNFYGQLFFLYQIGAFSYG